MDIAVLVKVVPPLEGLRYDSARRTVVRVGTELFLNPFDQRAVRVALDLRRPGEIVSVLSLGPIEARVPLRDTRALGVDRTVLLSDARFAGSDTLATARVLRAALNRVGHDLVLGGAWTTDSETGQVGPEVAALLDVPVLSGARAIERDPAGTALTVTVDTTDGWATYRARVPLVVTVGEKIAKPGRVTPEERARVPDSAVEILTLDDLSLPADRVGLAGSPTVVRSVMEDAPIRTPVVLAEGTPGERVAAAVAALRPHLRRPEPPARGWSTVPTPWPDDREAIVFVTGASGTLEPAALALISEVRRALPSHWPSVVWAGGPPSPADATRIGRAGALVGYRILLSSLPTDSRTAADVFGLVLDLRPRAAAGVLLSDTFGRETAGQLAAHRSLGLTGDAVGVQASTPEEIVWSKPSFGGRTIAGIVSRTRPSLATVRPGAWNDAPGGGPSGQLEWTVLPSLPGRERLVPTSSGTEVAPGTPSLDERDVVVVAGMGVGGPAGVSALEPLLAQWNAALGATRRVVDAGWVARQFQVGLTGRSPAPRLGVLLGVSGSTNHLVGWKRAGALLAVNRDPAAAVFRDVDVGIVGTVEEIVPILGPALAPLLVR